MARRTAAPMASAEPIVRARGIGKTFGGVAAVADADVEFRAGEIVGLCGENGAGKSTLIKILSGVQDPDAGTLEVEGRPVRWASPAEAIGAGITVIYQEFSLFPTLDAIENIVLGDFPGRGGVIDWRAARETATRALAEVGMPDPPRGPVSALGVGQQQLIEVARALSRRSRILIMDEPTAALSERETEALLELMRRLRGRGVGIVFVSHRLEELLAVCDRFVVMRDGRVVRELPRDQASREALIEAMVGRSIGEQFPAHEREERPEPALRVEGLSQGGFLSDVSLEVRRGEVVGLAGLMGSGRSSLLHAIFGSRPAARGAVRVADGEPFRPHSPREAMQAGIGLVPEDRRAQGLVGHMDVAENLALASLRRIARAGVVTRWDETGLAEPQVRGLGVRLRDLGQAIFTLSGGNQQKVVIGRWLAREPRVLLLDEPTRGVDVGAKAEIYRLIRDLTRQGLGVLMTSSELPELLGVTDRILVLHEGRLVGEVPPTASQEEIMHLATGGQATAVQAS